MRDTDEMHGCFAENQSPDSTSKVLGSILMSVSLSNKGKSSKMKHHDINRTYVQEQGRNSFTSDVSVCRTTQRRTSKNECGIVQEATTTQYSSTTQIQGVITTVEHQDGDHKTHNTGLIRCFQNDLDSTEAAKRLASCLAN